MFSLPLGTPQTAISYNGPPPIFNKPITSYLQYAYEETKRFLFNKEPSVWGMDLTLEISRLARNTEPNNPRSYYIQDFLLLFGIQEGGFEIATTTEQHYSQHLSIDVFTNKNKCYGQHVIEFTYPRVIPTATVPRFEFPYNNKTRTTEFVTKKTDDYVLTSEYRVHHFFDSTKNVVSSRRIKKSATHLFYFYKDKNAVIRKNKKSLYDYYKISSQHLAQFTSDITQYYPGVLPTYTKSLNTKQLFMYLKNPLWRDLNTNLIPDDPQRWYNNLIPASYAKLKYHHTRYGTRKLREIFFGTSSKSLQNAVTTVNKLQLLTSFSNPTNYPNLSQITDPNIKLKLIQNIDIDCDFSSLSAMDKMIFSGFSPDRIITLTKQDDNSWSSDFRDIGRMLVETNLTLEDCSATRKDNLSTIHDKVIRTYLEKKDAAYFGRPIELTEAEVKYADSYKNYLIVPVDITDTLSLFGTSLNICVRSYATAAIQKRCTIVALYKNNEPYCCIEVNKGRILQAKLKHNRKASSDLELHSYIMSWVEKNGLDASQTYDLKLD